MPVKLDPDAAAVFQAMKEANRPPYDTVTPAEAREMSRQTRAAVQPDPPDMAAIENVAVPAPHGAIPVRIYKPKDVAEGRCRKRQLRPVWYTTTAAVG